MSDKQNFNKLLAKQKDLKALISNYKPTTYCDWASYANWFKPEYYSIPTMGPIVASGPDIGYDQLMVKAKVLSDFKGGKEDTCKLCSFIEWLSTHYHFQLSPEFKWGNNGNVLEVILII
jgi:hypothetical protein